MVYEALYVDLYSMIPSSSLFMVHASNIEIWNLDIWQCVKTLVMLVNIKIAGKWMFIPLKMLLIGIDPYPYLDYVFSKLFRSPQFPFLLLSG